MARLDSDQLSNLGAALELFAQALEHGVYINDRFLVSVYDAAGENVYVQAEFDGDNGIYVVDV